MYTNLGAYNKGGLVRVNRLGGSPASPVLPAVWSPNSTSVLVPLTVKVSAEYVCTMSGSTAKYKNMKVQNIY